MPVKPRWLRFVTIHAILSRVSELVLANAQECRSTLGWEPVEVESSSQEGRVHTVLCNPWYEPTGYLCTCRGYQFAGHCKHQTIAHGRRCGWREIRNRQYTEIRQTPAQADAMECPKCLGETRWTMEMVYGEEHQDNR